MSHAGAALPASICRGGHAIIKNDTSSLLLACCSSLFTHIAHVRLQHCSRAPQCPLSVTIFRGPQSAQLQATPPSPDPPLALAHNIFATRDTNSDIGSQSSAAGSEHVLRASHHEL
ncbi:hypothetical protein C8Q80DRAFT_124197 [Daedaleopsis nitida]|nr:hypothetical protein C8Q80DRAFT_124197 [Daedaleopsis nitida]